MIKLLKATSPEREGEGIKREKEKRQNPYGNFFLYIYIRQRTLCTLRCVSVLSDSQRSLRALAVDVREGEKKVDQADYI